MRHRWQLLAAAVVAILSVVWLVRPSAYERVTNLDAGGSAIVAFGDSLTAGVGARDGEDYVSRLSKELGVPVVNAGVSGDTTESALRRVDDDVIGENPRIVIVGLGGNDFLRRVPPATTEENLRTIVRTIQKSGAMVVLLGFEFPSLGPNYGDLYERVAREEGCLLIPDVLDDVLNDPKLKSDEIHPNGAGYAIMAGRVAGPLAKLLDEADEAKFR